MDFFTPEWAAGDLDDGEFDRVIQRYQNYLEGMPASAIARRFAGTVSLNDAYLDRVTFDRSAGRLKLLLVTGDNQIGYWRTEIAYSGAHIVVGEDVLRFALSTRPSEVWYDEFSGAPFDLTHGFLLAPQQPMSLASPGEFRIKFRGLSFAQTRAEGRSLATADDQSVCA